MAKLNFHLKKKKTLSGLNTEDTPEIIKKHKSGTNTNINTNN